MSVTEHGSDTAGLPSAPQGTALPDTGAIDVTTLRGRRAVQRWERTSFGDVLERLRWSRPDQVVLTAAPGAHGEPQFAAVTPRLGDAVANRFAQALIAAGLEPGDRVLMICENSVEAYLAKIGVAKAGMVAAPLNPNLAPDVVEHLIGVVEPRFAVVDAELWPRMSGTFAATGLTVGATITIGGGPVEGSPSFGELVAAHDDVEPDVEIHGDDVLELLFTSGTTAMPKGVMLSHHYAQLAGMNFALSLSRGLRHDSDLTLRRRSCRSSTTSATCCSRSAACCPADRWCSAGAPFRVPSPRRSPSTGRRRCGPGRRSSSGCSRTSWTSAPSSTCRR